MQRTRRHARDDDCDSGNFAENARSRQTSRSSAHYHDGWQTINSTWLDAFEDRHASCGVATPTAPAERDDNDTTTNRLAQQRQRGQDDSSEQ